MTNYSIAAEQYWTSGWRGVLPLPKRQKTPPPKGTTGYDGSWPEWSTIAQWKTEFPDGNLALRLPNTVVGIDVDAYDEKKGNACLNHAVSLYGALPATVRSTSRLDGISGIRLFRVPAGIELNTVITFPDEGLDGIEVCQYFHRYVVVWPSIHPSTHRVYRWLGSDGNLMPKVPHVGSLPDLPNTWINALKRTPGQKTDVMADVDAFITSMPEGPMSLRVQDRLNRAIAQLRMEEV
jgi:Bifunctional DNA primase/polymerase, N-terminal